MHVIKTTVRPNSNSYLDESLSFINLVYSLFKSFALSLTLNIFIAQITVRDLSTGVFFLHLHPAIYFYLIRRFVPFFLFYHRIFFLLLSSYPSHHFVFCAILYLKNSHFFFMIPVYYCLFCMFKYRSNSIHLLYCILHLVSLYKL